MPLAPDKIERLARARADLRMGVPIAVEGGIICAAETCDLARFDALSAICLLYTSPSPRDA